MRNCGYSKCAKPLEGRPANTRFCDSTCRARAAEERALDGTDPDGFWFGLRRLAAPDRSPLRQEVPVA